METADRARARYRFDRLELAGSLGDLGTLLPFAIGMVMINGLNPSVLLLTTGLFYILAGLYFGVPTPVQPMKVIGAYAIATGVDALQITAAGFLMDTHRPQLPKARDQGHTAFNRRPSDG
jgi:SulP family sulfate permease